MSLSFSTLRPLSCHGCIALCIKRVRRDPNLADAVGFQLEGTISGIWNEVGMLTRYGLDQDHASLRHELSDALLCAEAEALTRVPADIWNHGLISAGWWSEEDQTLILLDGHQHDLGIKPAACPRGQFCLVTPWWPGETLDELSRAEQRRFFPQLLLSLWDALCAHAHGDLSPGCIVLSPDRARFHLVGPGGMVHSDVGHAQHPHASTFDPLFRREVYGGARIWRSCFFHTNTTYYPLLAPRLNLRIESGKDLRTCLGLNLPTISTPASFFRLHDDESAPHSPAQPDAADLIAMGLIYLQLLTGRALTQLLTIDPQIFDALKAHASIPFYASDDGPRWPLWSQHYYSYLVPLRDLAAMVSEGPVQNNPTTSTLRLRDAEPLRTSDSVARQSFIHALGRDLVAAILETGDVHPAEALLCARLIRHEITSRDALCDAIASLASVPACFAT